MHYAWLLEGLQNATLCHVWLFECHRCTLAPCVVASGGSVGRPPPSRARPRAQVLDQAMEIEAIIERYEALAAELLAWVQHTVTIISNQKFANSLTGVQQQLQAFTAFCTLEKPVK